ncbi:PLP-dependent aminotransferase family protein [Arsenicicoccus dermatophilus]|uniref:aminotransferase-like domain-containing protein n=1 Tax=Arsenicicoccus dermatophilus TaxID=1076331 RepID=UPI001F4CD79A|nr:PLP-dependent aminotransferase family protein [Arsenicicoccus dermatophilus]MCH8614090.1 PLP-dependent aminotransferase family protein [Arsenicicoccus dermatophilus]
MTDQHPVGSRLDPWVESYAARTTGMKVSEIRALFAVASRPEVVSLAGGMPSIDALPLPDVGATVDRLLREQGLTALQYSSGQGDPVLREQLLDVMRLEGLDVHPDDIVMTTGSQQALDLVSRVFLDPGDVVVAESPSYVGALGVFAAYQADVVHVPCDGDGLVPEALDEHLTRLLAQGRRIKFLYTVPTFQNPAGTALCDERRPRVLEVCRRHGVLVVEDNPYGLLGFEGRTYDALRSLDEEGVIYLGTFSKIFAAGLRVGWAVAPHAVKEKLVLANEAAILCPSAFTQAVASRYLAELDWQKQTAGLRELYRERRDAMAQALTALLPQATWHRPRGGLFFWIELPEGLDTKAMLPLAVKELVAYAPGTGFYADGSGRRNARLNFSYPAPDRIHEGVRRFATVVEREQELLETFGPCARTSHEGPRVLLPSPEVS